MIGLESRKILTLIIMSLSQQAWTSTVRVVSFVITGSIFILTLKVENTLTTPVTVENIAGSFGSLGLPIITFNHSFSALTLPASGTANSGIIPNATLTLGALSEVQLLLLRQLDVQNVAVTLRCVCRPCMF